MSKFYAKLSYKDWCILKHALAEKVKTKEEFLEDVDESMGRIIQLESSKLKYESIKKELSEEKATLDRITEIVDNFKEYIK